MGCVVASSRRCREQVGRTTIVAASIGALALLTGCAHDVTPRVPSTDSVVLTQEALIAAAPEHVWTALVDFPRYTEWNPWLVRAEGEPSPGAEVAVEAILGDERSHFNHIVLAVEPMTRFCWRDEGWTTAFAYGQRCRFLKVLPGGEVLFRQELLLEGPFRDTALGRYGAAMRAGLAAETRALKKRAESLAQGSRAGRENGDAGVAPARASLPGNATDGKQGTAPAHD